MWSLLDQNTMRELFIIANQDNEDFTDEEPEKPVEPVKPRLVQKTIGESFIKDLIQQKAPELFLM